MAEYANVREILGHLIGATVVDVTQQDPEEWAEDRISYVMLHFNTGATLKCPIGDDGFDCFVPEGPDE